MVVRPDSRWLFTLLISSTDIFQEIEPWKSLGHSDAFHPHSTLLSVLDPPLSQPVWFWCNCLSKDLALVLKCKVLYV